MLKIKLNSYFLVHVPHSRASILASSSDVMSLRSVTKYDGCVAPSYMLCAVGLWKVLIFFWSFFLSIGTPFGNSIPQVT